MDHWTASDSLYSDDNLIMYSSNDFNFGGGVTNKGKMQLDLASLPKKKGAALMKSNNDCVLTTPDLNMLQLASPELERLIIEQHGAITTPTPSGCFINGDLCKLGGRNDYAQRLATAYDEEKKGGAETQITVPITRTTGVITTQHAINPTPMIAVTQSSNTYGSSYGVNMLPSSSLKDEKPQIVPVASSTTTLPQIDLEEQEWVKKERKRERNRQAASRCRRRKLEKEKDLQDKVKKFKFENNKLSSTVETLRKEICTLKEQVLQHVGAGCHISLP